MRNRKAGRPDRAAGGRRDRDGFRRIATACSRLSALPAAVQPEAPRRAASALGIAGVDGRHHREAGPQGRLPQHLVGESHADRHPLDDLGEIAGRVFGRQQGELRPEAGAIDDTVPSTTLPPSASMATSTFCPGLMSRAGSP